MSSVSTRQSQRDRGRSRGTEQVRTLVRELAATRRTAGISQEALARQLAASQSEISRLERLVNVEDVSLVRLAEIGALLGFDLSAKLFPNGERLADRGHQALIGRFLAITSDAWRVAREVPLPLPGDRRSWDLLLRSPVRPGSSTQLVGVEAETRIRDVQWLVRRIRERERDGGADVVLLVLS